MISLYFGLPGCGKTTLLTSFAYEWSVSRSYLNCYSNVPLSIDGVQFIENTDIGKYRLEDALILIDEGTLFADSRRYSTISDDLVKFMLLHRHFKCDIIIFTQQWDALDKRIRVITDRCYYVYKNPIIGRWYTSWYQIPYGIIIPKPDENGNAQLGEIVQGYCRPPLFVRVFSTKRIRRSKYYRYFDSWLTYDLPDLPTHNVYHSTTCQILETVIDNIFSEFGRLKGAGLPVEISADSENQGNTTACPLRKLDLPTISPVGGHKKL